MGRDATLVFSFGDLKYIWSAAQQLTAFDPSGPPPRTANRLLARAFEEAVRHARSEQDSTDGGGGGSGMSAPDAAASAADTVEEVARPSGGARRSQPLRPQPHKRRRVASAACEPSVRALARSG